MSSIKEEYEIKNEIDYYNSLPFLFDGFIDVPELRDGEIHLVCIEKRDAEPERKRVPSYNFAICKGSEKIGSIHLLTEYNESIYSGLTRKYPNESEDFCCKTRRAKPRIAKAM